MKRRVISGADIVSKRSWRKAELSDAFLNQGLGCYRSHSVEKEYSDQSCITCLGDVVREQAEPDDNCFYGRRGCGGPYEVNFDTYLQRLMECDFDLDDIERLEEEHSIGVEEQPKRSKKQVVQDLLKAEREKRIESLFEKANSWAHEKFINQGRRMIHKELYAFLNSISDESVSDNIEKTIWKRLPPKAKNGPGRRPGTE